MKKSNVLFWKQKYRKFLKLSIENWSNNEFSIENCLKIKFSIEECLKNTFSIETGSVLVQF